MARAAAVYPAAAVSLVLNYIIAYQMMHRLAHASAGQRALVHGAAGGVGTGSLQLGRLAGLELYGTAPLQTHHGRDDYPESSLADGEVIGFVEGAPVVKEQVEAACIE